MLVRFTTLDFLPAPDAVDVEFAMQMGQPLKQGLAPMRAIVSHLKRLGVEICAPVDEWESYGWSFAIREEGAGINCMLQWGDEWLMMCWPHRTLGDRLRGRTYARELDSACHRIGDAICATHDASPPHWRDDA